MYPNSTVKRVLIAAAVAIVAVAVVLGLANQGKPTGQTAMTTGSAEPTAYVDTTLAGNPEPVSRYSDSRTTPRVAYAVSPFEPSEPRTLQPVMPNDQRGFLPEPLPREQRMRASIGAPPPPPSARRRVYYRQRVSYRHNRRRRGRPFNHSAMIVGGSAVGGAVIGGLAGGGKGAGIGALAGGAGGLMYDRATRNK
jgi:hypothetical protein